MLDFYMKVTLVLRLKSSTSRAEAGDRTYAFLVSLSPFKVDLPLSSSQRCCARYLGIPYCPHHQKTTEHIILWHPNWPLDSDHDQLSTRLRIFSSERHSGEGSLKTRASRFRLWWTTAPKFKGSMQNTAECETHFPVHCPALVSHCPVEPGSGSVPLPALLYSRI